MSGWISNETVNVVFQNTGSITASCWIEFLNMVHLVSKYRAIKQKRRCTTAKFNNEIGSSTILNFAFIKDLFLELLTSGGKHCFWELQEDLLVQLEVLPGCGCRPRWPGSSSWWWPYIWFLQASPSLLRCLATSLRRWSRSRRRTRRGSACRLLSKPRRRGTPASRSVIEMMMIMVMVMVMNTTTAMDPSLKHLVSLTWRQWTRTVMVRSPTMSGSASSWRWTPQIYLKSWKKLHFNLMKFNFDLCTGHHLSSGRAVGE